VNKLGKYELIQELGRGAMGIVYRARDPIINRLVALKTITKGVAEDANLLQRFYREAQSAGGLQHPNIVTIYDMGEEGGTPYIAMELVEGESLEQLIGGRPNLPLSLKLTYAIQACRAFDYAHKRGIIHRDIKPANVMLSKEGTVKVVDFGIARIVKSSKTQTGMLMGTFAYMAPEQYHGEHADERSDLWSFGVLLYELICYQRPFRGEAPANLMHSICDQTPQSLREIYPECPVELEEVLCKVLEKSPADRYQSMEDLMLELDPICRNLQSATVAKLVEQSHELVAQKDYPQAREILRQALQVESTNTQARSLLDKVNTELRRILIRPKAQASVEKGQQLLEQGRIQEARTEVESALRLDPTFEDALELQRKVQHESDRSQLVSQYLESCKLRLAEGLPDEAEQLLAKVVEIEPANKSARVLQAQVAKEKVARERRLRLLDSMQQARSLWTLQKYSECIELLTQLDREFPGEDEILRLLETAREEEAEQGRRQGLEKARSLLASGHHEESTAVLVEIQKQFPGDNEIAILLDEVREDLANQRKLQALGEARRLLAGRRTDECISLLTRLQQEFPAEPEIAKLLEAAREAELVQRRQQHVAKARKLLAARRYEECSLVLTDLRKRFPQDREISDLISALKEEQSEQRKAHALSEAGNLLAASHYDEALVLLEKLQQDHPNDEEVARLISTVRSDQAQQSKLQTLIRARTLLAQRRYKECIELVTDLRKSFPEEDEIKRLLETAVRDQSEQERQGKLAQARAFLAAGQLPDAQALLEELRTVDPKNPSVQKLLALVQGEQDKLGKAERLQREWKALKELVDEKKYGEVLQRANKLSIDFPNDSNLARLVEFARSQQSQLERQSLLGKSTGRVKALLVANRFQDALQAIQETLKTFPGNKELLSLQEQAEVQDRKYQTRKAIEQRIRDIKVKINREKFSEAVDLAQQTLMTLGPDTAIDQLLSSAKVELKAREKKRTQEKALETIRTLVEDGKIDQATQTLKHALETEALDSFDPRVERVSDEIDGAKNRSSGPSTPGKEPPQDPGFSKEYAWQMGPPAAPDVIEPNTQTQLASPQASAFPPVASGPPAAPPPSVTEIPPPARVESIKPAVEEPPAPARPPLVEAPPKRKAEPKITVETKPAIPVVPPARAVERPPVAKEAPPAPASVAPPAAKSPSRSPASSHPVFSEPEAERIEKERPPQIPRSPASSHPVFVPEPEPERIQQPFHQQVLEPVTAPVRQDVFDEIPLWKRPAVIVISAIILAVIWGGVHFLSNNRQRDVALIAPQQTETVQPPINPLEVKQREAIDSADKARAAGDLDSASRALKDGAALNGPLNPEIQKKLDDVQSEMNNAALAQVRRKEEQLWQQAKSDVDRGRFESAKLALAEIRQIPEGQGTRRDDAQTYLDQVIPQRQREDELLVKAKQDASKKDRNSLNEASTLSDQIIQLGGPKKAEAERVRQNAQTSLNALDKQQAAQQIASLESGARTDLKQGNFPAARQKAGAIKQSGGDPTSLSADIDKAEAAAQSRQQDEIKYQQAVQSYKQALAANDKSGIDAARDAFMWIAQGGGPHASDARKYVSEINEKNTTAQLAPPPAPVVKQETPKQEIPKPEIQPSKVNDEGEVRDVINRYQKAFEQRDADAVHGIWQNMGNSSYRKLKDTFNSLVEMEYRVQIGSVSVVPGADRATVSGNVVQSSTPKSGKKTTPRQDSIVFDLAKSNGKWFITGIR
jgi:eukaryotic-like serine/threonine-protein kinase